MALDSNEIMDGIRSYIENERLRRGVTHVDQIQKTEMSGIMQGVDGDILSFIERQLMTTEYGYGAWNELNDKNILKETYRVIEERLK